MCGLVGIYSSNLLMKHKECMAELLYLDTLRGRDSTGVAAIRHNADTATIKSTVPGYEFVEGPKLDQHLKLNDFCWIGHNRYGTVGRNCKANAHPFDILDEDGTCLVVGAHNGTLKNKHVLDDHNQFGTDSEALLNMIAFKSVEATIPLIEGAWALTWYDHVAEELRFLRNKERSLFYAYEDGRKTLIWASEMWMIRVACSRHNIKLENDAVFSVAEDTLYTFPVPLKTNVELTSERKGGLVGKAPGFFREPERWAGIGGAAGYKGTQQKTAPQNQTTGASQTPVKALPGLPNGTSSQSGTKTDGEKPQTQNGSTSNQQQKSEKGDDKVVSIQNAKNYKGYANRALSRAELESQLENGCGWCEQEHIALGDRYGWLANEKPICHKCLDGMQDEPAAVKEVTVH